MTTPDERRRTLAQVGAFLKELRSNDDLSDQVRREAHRLLRHYPTLYEIEQLAKATTGLWGGSPLGAEHDPDWLSGFPKGGHDGR